VVRGGIDFGGTKIQAVVVDSAHAVLGQSRHPTPTAGGPQDVADAMVAAMTEAADQAGVGASSRSAPPWSTRTRIRRSA
jgi:glucokinase